MTPALGRLLNLINPTVAMTTEEITELSRGDEEMVTAALHALANLGKIEKLEVGAGMPTTWLRAAKGI